LGFSVDQPKSVGGRLAREGIRKNTTISG